MILFPFTLDEARQVADRRPPRARKLPLPRRPGKRGVWRTR
jgi:hypothetical protein